MTVGRPVRGMTQGKHRYETSKVFVGNNCWAASAGNDCWAARAGNDSWASRAGNDCWAARAGNDYWEGFVRDSKDL